MAEDGSIRITAKGALVAGVVSLVLSPLALVLGYYVNRMVAGPRTNIVEVNVVPIHQLDPTVTARFYKSAILVGVMAHQFGNSTAQSNTGAVQKVSCDSWLHNGGVLDDRCVEPLKKWSQNTLDFMKVGLPQAQSGRSKPEWGLSKDQYVAYLTDLGSAAEALNSSLAHIDDSDSPNAGDAVFYIIFLNNGDGDDVVYPNAEVKFNGGSLNIKSGEYATLKSHSFQQSRYETDRGSTPQNDLKVWSQFVRRSAEREITVIIHLGGNRSTTIKSRVQG